MGMISCSSTKASFRNKDENSPPKSRQLLHPQSDQITVAKAVLNS